MDFIQRLGQKGIAKFNYFMDLSALFWKSTLIFFQKHNHGRKVVIKNTLKQILFTGIDGLPVISTVSVLLGGIIIIQSYTLLAAIGSGEMITSILVLVIVRELGPILTAFIVIGRSGTALSTELGNMVVSHEIDALRSMGIDPIRFLIAPRVFGMVFSMLLLGIYFDLAGLMGGFIVSQLQINLPFDVFMTNLLTSLTLEDIFVGLLKNISFGIAIAIVSCYHGMSVSNARTEVPQRATKAVVSAIFICFFLNAFFTAIFYI